MENENPISPAPTAVKPSMISATDLIKDTFSIWKDHWKKLIVIVLLPQLVIVPVAVFFVLWSAYIGSSPELVAPTYAALPMLLVALAGSIVYIVVQIWMSVTLLEYVVFRGEGLSVRDAFARGRKKIGSYFWVGLLSSLIVGGASMLFIVPGIVLGVWFTFGTYVVVSQGGKGFAALYKSKRLVEGYWAGVAGRSFLLFLLMVVLYLVSEYVSTFLNSAGSAIPFLKGALFVWDYLLGLLLIVMSTTLPIIFTSRMFESLVEIKGEVDTTVTRGTKLKYAAVSLAGLLMFFVVPVLLILAFTSSRPLTY